MVDLDDCVGFDFCSSGDSRVKLDFLFGMVEGDGSRFLVLDRGWHFIFCHVCICCGVILRVVLRQYRFHLNEWDGRQGVE